MSTATIPSLAIGPILAFPDDWTLADLQTHLGGVPASRIRVVPPLGRATEEDSLRTRQSSGVLCELIDGVLVEKCMGAFESAMASYLGFLLHTYLQQHPLGVLMGPDGPFRTAPGKLRMPDVMFIRWERFPGRVFPRDKVLDVIPDLVVEILSSGNTAAEIEMKLDEYFQAGAQLAWIIDPDRRTAAAYKARTEVATLDENGLLQGGAVLPGFTLRVGDLLDFLPR